MRLNLTRVGVVAGRVKEASPALYQIRSSIACRKRIYKDLERRALVRLSRYCEIAGTFANQIREHLALKS